MATVGRVGTVKGVGSPPYLCFSPSSCPALGSLGAQLSSPPSTPHSQCPFTGEAGTGQLQWKLPLGKRMRQQALGPG